jgi:hypothetical protein
MGGFKTFLKDIQSLWAIVIGGPILLPFVVTFSGIAPPWPPNEPKITSAILLLTLIATYSVSTEISSKSGGRKMILCAVSAVAALMAYLFLLNVFTFVIPTNGERTVVGCGFTHNAALVAKRLGVASEGSCPGQYENMLAGASYNSYEIWPQWSLAAISALLFVLWETFFINIGICSAIFVLSHRASKGFRSRRRAPPRPKSEPRQPST